jgi:anti-anti-sigma regulatory factor
VRADKPHTIKGLALPVRVTDTPAGQSPGDHLCWPYLGRREFTQIANEYILEGLGRGERIVIVTGRPVEELTADLSQLPDLEDHLATGQVVIADYREFMDTDRSDPDRELRMLEAMNDASLEAGFPGMRILSDATDDSLNQEWRAWHAATEHMLDRFCLLHPVTAICAYDITVLDPQAVAEMAVLHATTREDFVPFQLRATTKADLSIAGSVDAFSADQLELALDRLRRDDSKGLIVIDATEADFLDHRALMAIDRHAARNNTIALLWSPQELAERVTAVLDLTALRVVVKS